MVENFIKNCIENDIEMSSSDGLFFGLVMQEMIMARVKQVS